MLKLTRKAGSHHVLRRQQGQNSEKGDTNPCQEANRCPRDASGHFDKSNNLGVFSKPILVSRSPLLAAPLRTRRAAGYQAAGGRSYRPF
jgi:hypothetical protein